MIANISPTQVAALTQPASFDQTASPYAGRMAAPADPANPHDSPELRKAFDDFVGQTFFSQMLSAMRKTVGKPAYFHGGRAEEVFQGQLDQVLSEKLSEATADQFAGPMYELMMMNRK
jgi:flagellar protein FlgJ